MNKIKILIVDDYKENILALSQLIASEDLEIFEAMNAEEALELITMHEFGLALLDVQMPNTTGLELAKIIRSVNRFRSLPIIFVTAHQENSSIIFEGYQTGAVDLLFKPLNPNAVRAKVQMFVELAQQRARLQSYVQELEQLKLEAESANIAKNQFLANMSHEIRTPLSAVMGFAELLTKKSVTDEEKKECAAAIKRNGQSLMRLIDDILDTSKIEAGKLEFENEVFDLFEILNDVDSTMSIRAKENGVHFSFKNAEISQTKYYADSVRIKQVLLNIIGNAIKFTQGGSVTVSTKIETLLDSENDKLSILIIDNGVGITPDQAEKLFSPFSQGDSSTKRRFGGSGLGLVISRQIARALDGDIRLLQSEQNKGSTFLIELTLPHATEKNLQKTSAHKDDFVFTDDKNISLTHMKILAVDDSPDNLTLLSHYLKQSQAQLTFATSGVQALEEMKKADFDLVLMDVQMPGLDGHETTREIRRRGFTKPIIALTAHAQRSEHEKCKQAGCDDVLTKPVSKSKLLTAVQFYV
jgi:two-component system, sensor histidine kinase